MQRDSVTDPRKPAYPWWEFLFPGLIFLLGSIFAWWYLTDLEARPGAHRLRLPSIAVLLYEWGGKWAIVLFIAGVGVLFSAIGAFKLIRKLQNPQRPAERDERPPP